MSAQGGVSTAPQEASAIGARAFALFTRNPQRWSSKAITAQEAELFRKECERLGYAPEVILPHDGFLINLGSPDADKLSRSRKAFLDELRRCEQLGLTMLNFHPGSHVNQMSEEECLDLIAESVNLCLAETTGVVAVLENTAGQGSNLGYSFEHLRHIIDRIDDKSRVGVCIDTCHAFAAGYNLATDAGYEQTWQDFDRVIGLQYLRGMHINDAKKPVGSRVDRHAPLATGTLGEAFFRRMMNDPRLDGIPMILETPDESLWPQEIAWLYSLMSN